METRHCLYHPLRWRVRVYDSQDSGVLMNDKVEATLKERGSSYGDVREQAALAEAMKERVHWYAAWDRLPPEQKQSIDMILLKISRIVTGSHAPQPDSWLDIQGYAKLPFMSHSDE